MKDNWIFVEDTLPDAEYQVTCEDVLCVVEYPHDDELYRQVCWYSSSGWSGTHGKVLCWQPLPELPEKYR